MAAVDELRHRWNRFEYELLDPDAFGHTELIDGEILDMSPMSGRHSFTTNRLTKLLMVLAQAGEGVGCQTPIVLDDYSEPEPDVWVTRREPTTLEEAKPTPADLLLVVEVADSSVVADRKVKIPLYGRAGVPVVWLAHVGTRTVTVYSDPVDGQYATTEVFADGQDLAVPFGGSILVDSLFLR